MGTLFPLPRHRRWLAGWALSGVLASVAGCASLNTVESTVSSFGNWPAGRAPGRYFFDVLPSQQSQPHRREALEQAVRPALEAAGFRPAPQRDQADVLVTLGARVSALQPSPWRDPAWPAVWGPRWPNSPWAVPGWQLRASPQAQFEREVALLLRDRSSGEALFETRALSQGYNQGTPALLGAMFSAAMKDFPRANAQPHDVAVALPDAP